MHPAVISDKQGDCPICNMKLVPIRDDGDQASGADKPAAQVKQYYCPMHPEIKSDKPGDCPTCNMKLVPAKEGGQENKPPGKPAVQGAKYHCPMHPAVISDKPGDCPICNMKLVPIRDDGGGKEEGKPGTVSGRIAIRLSPEKRQLIGVQFSTVEKRELSQSVRTTAVLEHDETSLAKISLRFSGWVRDLKVNFTGQTVAKGDPLLTVYSPDLLSAENEYLLAYQRFAALADPTNTPPVESARRLMESARRRLKLWNVADEEIISMEKSGQAKDEMLIRSPVSGHVISKTAVEGKAFMPGEALYEIGDMMHLWLRASVFEFEFPLVKIGQKARVTFPYLGNKTYESTVTFLYPHIEQQTRRAEIRLEMDNPRHELRPQMWANVEIDASFGETVAVPASSVIDTGERFVAFVQGEGDRLEPRDVKIGVKTSDFYQVLDGVKEGEKVVTRALFLVDSESQLKYAISGMASDDGHPH